MMTAQRLQKLRMLMKQKQYDYYLVPSTDAHNSEYVPKQWQRRPWISGFTGSAGEALVGENCAFLSTDGRYFLQAENELDPDCYQLLKQSGYRSEIDQWLERHSRPSQTLALDPATVSIARGKALIAMMDKNGGHCVFDDGNLIDKLTEESNISLPKSVFIQPLEYAGQELQAKLADIRARMKDKDVDTLILSVLDEIAWLLNIRGHDIAFNPLVISYVMISASQCRFYVAREKLDDTVLSYLHERHVEICDYEAIKNDMAQLTGRLWLDDKTANFGLYQLIADDCELYFAQSPVVLAKACKNSTEIKGAFEAHKKDAVAVISFLAWLTKNWRQGVDELKAEEVLLRFRQMQDDFMGASFDTISGFAANGAIIHYRADEKTSKRINDQHLYLLDSGGQYRQGTTDITRTIHLGEPSSEERKHYTLVLKGHLALARAKFPKGVKGEQIDALARMFLWQNGLDYRHGTGHGVGSFLCVHEGPQRIAQAVSDQPLMPGMILSNEPGFYLDGAYGIRIENLCLVTSDNKISHNGFGDFYGFEDLTLVPYDNKLIDEDMLTEEELAQLKAYYSRIEREILPLIDDEAIRLWLLDALNLEIFDQAI
ncbi:MAG: aminopeptidase P family protein [Francisellaceae bacterium]